MLQRLKNANGLSFFVVVVNIGCVMYFALLFPSKKPFSFFDGLQRSHLGPLFWLA
jgi:hypothetical protein